MLIISDFSHIKISDQLYINPDYLNHPKISGNKMRKLKYHLVEFVKGDQNQILTFGGAYSNHIAAVAALGKQFNIKTIGVIRGEELKTKEYQNPTLKYANECGMKLEFVSREHYRLKESLEYLDALKNKFGNFYHIPEGGTSALAVKGCEEILLNNSNQYDYVCVSVGTGGTLSGLSNSAYKHQKILGFTALNENYLEERINQYTVKNNWKLIRDYHFGGFAKINSELISFINEFYSNYKIPLDPIYTGKMLFGIFDMIKKGVIEKDKKVLAIHTGGLQGIEGMNQVLTRKKLPIIEVQ
ncbi:MAG: 1-aminocyclopropane-1-carboxylate deaminase/D-cysteine desulfhydrase [bacterium]